ncbi:MFS transporter [Blastomonas aquatica]|uniref:MFS transporter n=1 Tax=Blastomonas aquatica TaxID=1510276 RepID=A0ABQ1J2W5_9SPHN|nr:MFS transporter [Blastomonas aquatica]GGB56107.1 MFS transporter [Blastomonas aquatica]
MAATYLQGETANRQTAKGVTLVFAQVLPVMAIVALFPAIPKLFEQFGSSPNAGLLVPMIVTMPSLCAALFAPAAGWVADRFGRRPAFIFGIALYILAGIVPLFVDDLGIIVASRAVLGLADAFAITISSALIGDYFGEQRYRWVAWTGAATSIAGTALIAAGGILADISWRGPFAIYLLAVPLLIMAVAYIDEPVTQKAAAQTSKPAGFPWRAAAIIGSVTLITSVVYYVEPLNIATVLADKGAGSSTNVGLIQAATSLAYIAGAFLYRRLHEQSIGVLLGIAGALIGAGMIVIGLSDSYQTAAAGATIQQLGGGMIIPALLAWGQAKLPFDQRGRGMGIWATAFFAGAFVCPPIVSALAATAGGLQPAIIIMGVSALVLAAAVFLFMGRARNAAAAAQ